MNYSPKISIIIPIYNAEKYLCRCVDSIIVQTFTDFELLLIDDGSLMIPNKSVINMLEKIYVFRYFIKKMEV